MKNNQEIKVDVCIIGGGSSGIGAAFGLIGSSLKVLLIEKNDRLGGTFVNSNVNRWEPGPDAPFCAKLVNALEKDSIVIKGANTYDETLYTKGSAIIFNREKYVALIEEKIEASNNIEICKNTRFVEIIDSQSGHISSIKIETTNGYKTVSAAIFIDATAGAQLCVANNNTQICNESDLNKEGYFLGCDPSSFFNENNAPKDIPETTELNAPDFCFEIQQNNNKNTDPKPTSSGSNPGGFAYKEPGKGYIVNPCDALKINGYDLYTEGEDKLRKGVEKKAKDFFEKFKKYRPQYIDYKIVNIETNPLYIGIRENKRINSVKMLSQQNIEKKLEKDKKNESYNLKDFIAIASHPVDIHGSPNTIIVSAIKVETYGIPYGCIVPKGSKNYFIVSMSAGFSHIAAASVRLSRTMMQLGYAAAQASILILANTKDSVDVDVSKFIYEETGKINKKNIVDLQDKIKIEYLLNRLKIS